MSRKAIITYFLFVSLFSLSIYFLVLYRKRTLFSPQALETIISTTSRWRTKYLSPCDSAINGDPSIGDNWVKITFHCPQGVKNSTLALTVFREKSWENIITEYARIIGFSPSEVLAKEKWSCYLDRKILISDQSQTNWNKLAQKKESIDCIDSGDSLDYLTQYYEKK